MIPTTKVSVDCLDVHIGHHERDVGVRPDGRQYLATPHSDGALTVHAFPGGHVDASLDGEKVLPEDDWFDFQAGYVTNELILVGSVEKEIHLLLSADTLTPVTRIEYPDGATRQCISATGRGTWLTLDFVKGRHQVWRLAEGA